MEYRVVITSDAEADLEGFIRYLLFEKKSNQAETCVPGRESTTSKYPP